MVKIPELEEDGQNWKIYRAKYLEVAATENLLSIVAGLESDDGSKDWDHRNRVARMLLYITLPPLLQSHIQLLQNAREVFRYLAFYFRDCEPIVDPRAKKLATCANDDKRYPSAGTPTSKNAATGTGREDLPMKALNRGNEDINDRNVGREDPRTSLEASAKGNSAKSARTTVQLESAPHKTQNVPQNPLPLTPGECKQEAADGVVTAERTKGMVGMAKPRKSDADVDGTAALGGEPAERVQGVGEGDETERDEHESQPQQINFYCKESCQRNGNANGNVPSAHKLPLEGEWVVCASGKVSSSSGHADESIAALSASTVQPEFTDGPSESRKAEDTAGVELRGCKGGTSGRANVDEADGNAGRELERVDAQNELAQLLTTTVEPYVSDGDTNACVHLKCTSWRAGDANGPGRGTDGSRGQADGRRGWTDTLGVPNKAETAGISRDEGAETYLGVRDTKRVVDATNGIGSHADASNGHTDVPSVDTDAIYTAYATQNVSIPRKRAKPPDSPISAAKRTPDEPNGCGDPTDTSSVRRDTPSVGTHAITPANASVNSRTRQNEPKPTNSPMENEQQIPGEPNGHGSHADASSVRRDAHCAGNGAETTADETEIVRTSRNRLKPLNSPMETARRRPDEPNGCGSCADGSSACTDAHCVGNETETARNEAKRVRTRRNDSRTQNSPNGRDIATPRPTSHWRKVSVDDGDVYVPLNAPIVVPSRKIVFGRVESGDEAIAPSVEGERAGEGDGGGYGDDGDVGDTTSGGDVDSKRVEAALLAGDSQLERQSRKIQTGNLPVSSRPPTDRTRRPYGLARRRPRRGRLKIERINGDQVSKAQKVETTHLAHAYATQPPENDPNQAYGVVRPRRRRGRIKIEPRNVSRTRNGGNAYLRRVNAIRSTWRPKKQIRRLDKLTFECRMQGERRRDDGDYG